MFKGETMKKIFNGKKAAKLGTENNPAVVYVKTKKRMKYKIEVERDKPEDITDLEILMNWPEPQEAEKKVGRNEPCPCGSGKKYKKCCGR